MRTLLAVVLFASSAMAAPSPWTDNRNDLDITNYVEEVVTPTQVYRQLSQLNHHDSVRDSIKEVVIIEQIINLGQKIWAIVEKNKPVVNVKYSYANAVPKGIKDTDELENFSPIQHVSYRMHGKNGFGFTVYDLTYTLVHRYGATYEGRGKYLDSVAVVPSKLNVLWGYTVNFNVDRVSTVNVGDKAKPVASVLLGLEFKVSTVIKSSEFHGVYEFRGDAATVRAVGH